MRRIIFLICTIVLSQLSLIGCATVASRETMIQETQNYQLPATLENNQDAGLIYVVRPSMVGTLVRFNVFVNDTQVKAMEAGWTRGNQFIYFFVSPGDYKIFSYAENTAEQSISIEKNKIYYIEQVPQMGFIMARNELRIVDEVEGKYYLKKCEMGNIIRKDFRTK
jgi:hypothetical protein